MMYPTSEDMVLALEAAPVDPRTGNKVIYNASWIATNDSMIGKRNEDWVRRELDWFRSGSNSLHDMEAPVPQAFQACADPDGIVNSAYGHILFGKGEELPPAPSLAERIVATLINEGLGTRHAVAIISDRDIHNLAHKNGRNDFICTNALNVMVDHENQLNIIAQMRSMDAVWGYRADYSMWDFLMEWLLGSLEIIYPDLKRGHITFQVANLHVYPRHFELLTKEADRVDDELNRRARRIWMDRALREQAEARDVDPHHNEPAGTGEATA
ncbi:thymidylate synthase [Microbacterium phage Pikmin]|uniref:Thymidylate synthase n=2 Tax=Pikminvirus pikmin TaxID=2560596 RepID=A0A2P1CKI2_9CAUD|nr:thymidylate synthase [Microbacterium phage Pikmin]AVJ51188.1 thymidylate synthase [Microbacterium phage Pikmin]AVJ51746.1 thymidylate synthase [Microbacterium phage Casey]